MQLRVQNNQDVTDLLIGGVEVSLWMAEQVAADLRRIFPNLNVSTTSSNKLLGLGDDNPSKVFFPGAEEVLQRRINSNTVILLISQSGQTFPTLHATRKLARSYPEKLYLLTGCFNSKMEQALMEGYKEHRLKYKRNRVFNNYSGHRPAEPSSVAVAATWHTLTKMVLHMVSVNRKLCPSGRMIHPWKYEDFAMVIQRFFLRYCKSSTQQGILAKNEHGVTGFFFGKDTVKSSVESKKNHIATQRVNTSKVYKMESGNQKGNYQVVMNLSDGCIEDIECIVSENLIPNVSHIVGYDIFGREIASNSEGNSSYHQSTPLRTHELLVNQGKAWAEHVNETWQMLVLAAIYILFSVTFQIPIFGATADAILHIIRACGAPIPDGVFEFTPRTPYIFFGQPIAYTIIGAVLQVCDALFYIYIAKNLTRLVRIIRGRPLAARHGKRTIVVVDTPCVHQLVEIFVSKLFSQSYSIVSVDVHGASGLDHFVHRFTHRVVRGVLIAVGRPDGRLCCLAKSEASILLATKQAAFIRNPDYAYEGNGPEIVTIGHNPFQPNLGLARHVVLHNGFHRTSVETSNHVSAKSQHSTTPPAMVIAQNRNKFVDEYLYDRLFLAKKPFTVSILRALRRTLDNGGKLVKNRIANNPNSSVHSFSNHSKHMKTANRKGLHSSHHHLHSNHSIAIADEPLPYGVHHIDPSILFQSNSIESSVFADFVMTNKEHLNAKTLEEGLVAGGNMKSNDPAVRLAFSSKLDSQTRQIQDLQVIVQQFYECRVASLERYLSFCVMFHAMATECRSPWFLYPWDIARSQSNLRVATTASPISGGGGTGGDHAEASQEVKQLVKEIMCNLRNIIINF
jgi:uncharacterized membrane protein